MRFTSHLGYLEPGARPQFQESAAAPTPVALAEHAAAIGMAGVFYPWAMARPTEEVREVGAALRANGLACSSISLPLDMVASGCWIDRAPARLASLRDAILRTSQVADSLGSTLIAVFIDGDGSGQKQEQLTIAADTVREMADVAAEVGLAIVIEPLTVFPNSLLCRGEDALRFVRGVDRPNVKLVFDTAHFAGMEADIISAFCQCYEEIALIQFADMPGRFEPGTGSLDIAGVAAEAVRRGYAGLVDLEHDWVSATAAGEARGLGRLRALDAEIRVRAAQLARPQR
jgi:hydroxypyruvate isomerase